MMPAFPRRLAAFVLALAALNGTALGPAAAQSQNCGAWRAELANLQGQRSAGNPGAEQAARRANAELSQLIGYYRQIGCERGGFLFFGEQAPPQCGGIRARIGQLQAEVGALQQRAQGGGGAIEQRRGQLAAAIDSYCRPQQPQQQRGFFETIFGLEPRRGTIDSTLPELDPEQPVEPERPRSGGPYTVCVRTCDGFFFPLANSPGGRDGADEMCQALCPGSEASAYGMSNGGDIQNAVARSGGQPYMSLPNALKYTKSFDAACTCKAQGQSWSQVLRDAETLLDKRKGDVIVTEQRAAELSRPRAETQKPEPRRRGQPLPPPVAAPVVDETPLPSENSPTAGTESAGVGPDSVGERVRGRDDGLKRETQSVTGEKRTVRIVAPNLAPNLGPSATRP